MLNVPSSFAEIGISWAIEQMAIFLAHLIIVDDPLRWVVRKTHTVMFQFANCKRLPAGDMLSSYLFVGIWDGSCFLHANDPEQKTYCGILNLSGLFRLENKVLCPPEEAPDFPWKMAMGWGSLWQFHGNVLTELHTIPGLPKTSPEFDPWSELWPLAELKTTKNDTWV